MKRNQTKENKNTLTNYQVNNVQVLGVRTLSTNNNITTKSINIIINNEIIIYNASYVKLANGEEFINMPNRQYKNHNNETKYAKDVIIHFSDEGMFKIIEALESYEKNQSL